MKQRLSFVFSQFNWRALLVRLLVYAVMLALVTGLVPQIYFKDKHVRVWLMVSAGFGVLNALVVPLLQALMLRLLFASFGLVLALINALMLYLLARIFPARFAVDSFLWALVGGILLVLLGAFLEGPSGLTRPIVPESEEELRQRLKAQDRGLVYMLFRARQSALVSEDALPQVPGLTSVLAPSSSSPDGEAGKTAQGASGPSSNSAHADAGETAAEASSQTSENMTVRPEHATTAVSGRDEEAGR